MRESSLFKTVMLSAGIMLMCSALLAGQNPRPAQDGYNITVLGVYDYGRTFSGRGGFDVVGHMPFASCLETDAAFEYLGPKILSGTIVARPKFPLKTGGELFLDAAANLRTFNGFGIGTFVLAASFGYRTEYVCIQLGAQRTLIHDFQNASGDAGSDIAEPLNPLFRIAFNVRPAYSPWNISLGVGNFTLYQYERIYYPIFFIAGHLGVTDRMTALAEVDFKPSGIFNYNAHFNELTVRAGLTYSF